jgi:hypothetical protein
MEPNQADLIALHRSTAMLPPGSKTEVERDVLLQLVDELLSQRALLQRLGADLKSVARKAP